MEADSTQLPVSSCIFYEFFRIFFQLDKAFEHVDLISFCRKHNVKYKMRWITVIHFESEFLGESKISALKNGVVFLLRFEMEFYISMKQEYSLIDTISAIHFK